MNMPNIQQAFQIGWEEFQESSRPSAVQQKAARSILQCKTGKLGYNTSICQDCGHTQTHANSCRNRNCPNCQAVQKEIWVDRRGAEVIDAPYFHVVFTLPHELNALIYCNQPLLYGLLHRCCAQTILELSADRKFLGATPGIIQVLHTWDQELGYHVHMHCIVSGGGLTEDKKLRKSKDKFFIPVYALRDKFKGKYLSDLEKLHKAGQLVLSASCQKLRSHYEWNSFRDSLYQKDWCPFIKETFNGFGNAIEYLGRYTHKIAISNSRIVEVTESSVTFSARGKKAGDPRRLVTLDIQEFIRRFLMHVLPPGFQKIRYYGFLNNRGKSQNLKTIFKLQGRQRFKARYAGMSMAELLLAVWGTDICLCPVCGGRGMRPAGRSHYPAS